MPSVILGKKNDREEYYLEEIVSITARDELKWCYANSKEYMGPRVE